MTDSSQDKDATAGTPTDGPATSGRWARFWSHPRTRATLRHPLFPLAALVVFCLIVEETYPFSDFPMYSSLSPDTHYFYVTDEDDQALPVKGIFGISASELKKIYHSKLTPMALSLSEETGKRVKASELGEADQAIAGDLLLEQLMPRTEGRSWWKENYPTELRLKRVDIHRADAELSEIEKQITVRKLKIPQPATTPPEA